VQAGTFGPFTYVDNGTSITIIACQTSAVGEIDVPATIVGKPVTSLQNTFTGCHSVNSVTIPASVSTISTYTFFECGNLSTINVDSANTTFSSVDGMMLNKSQNTLLVYPVGKGESITIPASVTNIGTEAFSHCTMVSITIPSNVESIGDWAFDHCSHLTSAYFSGNAPSVGTSVFNYIASGFTVYYFNDKTSFASPTWNGYPAVNMGNSSPATNWLLSNNLPYNSDLQSTPNGVGVSLLMAYAFNLNPRQNQSGNLPKPVLSGNQLSLKFYAGSSGVKYTVEASTDMKSWSTAGVTLSALDANNFRTATVNQGGPGKFLRIVTSY